jgi:urease beta subunit
MGREIVTKGARFYCVSLQPDICKTPIGPATPPIPYTIKGEFADASGVSPDILSNDEPVVIHASTVIPTVSGDEQGTAKGVKSGTVSKRVQHDQRSSTVRFNGERAIRVGDTVFMNDKNTIGKIYKREGAGGHVAVSAQRDATTAREKPGHAVSTSDTKNSFAQRFQDLLSFVKSAKSEIVALDGNVRNAPGSLLTDAFKKTPSLASAVGGEAIKNAVQDIARTGMKSLASKFPIFQKTLGKTPAFISSAILNRIPGVPRTAVQTASALHAEGGQAGPEPGKGDDSVIWTTPAGLEFRV